jgi:hypothetical protein
LTTIDTDDAKTRTDVTITSAIAPNDRRRLYGGVLAAAGVVQVVSLLVNPGPDVADVHSGGWVPGHVLGAAAYILFAAGLPALLTRTDRSYGVLGALGYLALAVPFAVSTGSQLYYLAILPELARFPQLHDTLAPSGRLASIYTTQNTNQVVTMVLAAATLPLALAMWRSAASLRRPAALLAVAQLAAMALTPLALVLMSVLAVWLGVRVQQTGDVAAVLRRYAPSRRRG